MYYSIFNQFQNNFILITYIFVWFVTNYIFILHNKKLLNSTNNNNLIITIGLLQLAFCLFFGYVSWIISNKNIPNINNFDLIKYVLFGIISIFCHIFSMYSQKLNSIFTNQIIRAIEPIIYLFFEYLIFGNNIDKNKIIFTGLIIIGGCLSSIKFTNNNLIVFEIQSIGLMFGLAANLFSCLKLILTKLIIQQTPNIIHLPQIISKVDIQEILLFEYNLINIFSFIIGLPIWFLFERKNFNIIKNNLTNFNFVKYLVSSSLCFYLFNYFSILILYNIEPINQFTLGIIKRILIMLIGFIFFNDEINLLKIIGIFICISAIIYNSFN